MLLSLDFHIVSVCHYLSEFFNFILCSTYHEFREHLPFSVVLWQNWKDLSIAYFLNMEGFWMLLPWRRLSFEDKHGLCLVKLQLPVMQFDKCKTFLFMISLWWVLKTWISRSSSMLFEHLLLVHSCLLFSGQVQHAACLIFYFV